MSGFKVISDFSPKGDQPAAITKIVENLNNGLLNQTLLGVTGSGKTYTIAKVIEETQRPAIIMAPNKTLAAQLYGELKQLKLNDMIYFIGMYDSQDRSYQAVSNSVKPLQTGHRNIYVQLTWNVFSICFNSLSFFCCN